MMQARSHHHDKRQFLTAITENGKMLGVESDGGYKAVDILGRAAEQSAEHNGITYVQIIENEGHRNFELGMAEQQDKQEQETQQICKNQAPNSRFETHAQHYRHTYRKDLHNGRDNAIPKNMTGLVLYQENMFDERRTVT